MVVSPLQETLGNRLMIKLVEVKKIYKMGTVDVTALNGVSLKIDQGEFIAIIGASGSGKSTMMNILGCLDVPTSGQSIIDDQNVEEMSGDQLAEIRNNKIGFVFQTFNLLSRQTALSNVLLPLMYSNEKNRKSKSQAALEKVGLGDRIHHKPTQLSGGQQQRVALGRALINSPQLLLMDEPFSSLDSALRAEIREEVRQIVRTAGITTIFVTHDQQEAMYFGDTIAVMNNGSIEQYGTPEELFHAPRTRFVAEFMGAVDFVPCDLKGYQLQSEFNTVSVQNPYVVQQIQDDKDSLTFMSRPDCIELELDEVGHGTIVSREFYGAFYLYIVKLHSGALLRSLMPHTSEYQPGQSVSISIRDGHTLKTFLMDKLIEEVI